MDVQLRGLAKNMPEFIKVPIEWVGDVRESLDEAFAAIAEGKAK